MNPTAPIYSPTSQRTAADQRGPRWETWETRGDAARRERAYAAWVRADRRDAARAGRERRDPHYATNVDGIGEGDNLAADYAATPDALARDAARRLDHFRTAVDRIGARADVRAALAARTDDDYFEAGAWTVVRLLDRASDAAALAAEATSAARRAALASLATYYAGYVPRDLRAALAAA